MAQDGVRMMIGIIAHSHGAPIEAAIAEALSIYERKFNRPAEIVRIHISNPASVDVPGVDIEYVRHVLPGDAWAGAIEEE